MIRVSVLYPAAEGKKFDATYYLQKHMPLVRERLGKAGLVRAEVDKGVAGGAPGAPAPYVYVAHVYFNSVADFQKAMGSTARRSWAISRTTRTSSPIYRSARSWVDGD